MSETMEAKCLSKGVKLTDQRRVIVKVLSESKEKYGLKISEISNIYINRSPGSFAGIRNSLAVVKAVHVAKKIDYYCFSFDDFDSKYNEKYENIPNLCDRFKIKKNLINPIYIS